MFSELLQKDFMDATFILTEQIDISIIKDNIFLEKHNQIDDTLKPSLSNYLKQARKNKGKINITYNKKKKYGRFYVKNHSILSATIQKNNIRATLYKNSVLKLDIINSHYSILKNELLKLNIQTPTIDLYLNNRNIYLSDHPKEYKKLYIALLYGGSKDTWENKNNHINIDIETDKFIKNLNNEIQKVSENIIFKYKHIAEYVKIELTNKIIEDRKKQKKYISKKDLTVEDYDLINNYNLKGKQLSLILQELETNILMKTMDFLTDKKINITSYIYDELFIEDKEFNDDIITELNLYIKNINPYIHFKKSYITDTEEPLDLEDINKELDYFNSEDFNNIHIADIESKIKYFEKHIFFLNSPSSICKIDTTGEVIFYKYGDFKNSYDNIFFIECKDENNNLINYNDYLKLDLKFRRKYENETPKKNFFELQKKRPNRRQYDKIVYNPPPLKTPAHHYNEWRGFSIEKIDLDLTADTTLIYEHIKLIADYNDDIYNYLIKWLSHIIQKPAVKTGVIIAFYSDEQGTGKNFLAEHIIRGLIGDKLHTTQKMEELTQNFNSIIKNKHVISVEEPDTYELSKLTEAIKALTTRTEATITKKGHDGVALRCCCNITLTMNKIGGLTKLITDPKERRFFPVEVPAYKKGNKTYFNNLMKATQDDKIMRKFFYELQQTDLNGFNPQEDRPITKLRERVCALSKNILIEFYEYLYTNNIIVEDEKFIWSKSKNKYLIKKPLLYELYIEYLKDHKTNLINILDKKNFYDSFMCKFKTKIECDFYTFKKCKTHYFVFNKEDDDIKRTEETNIYIDLDKEEEELMKEKEPLDLDKEDDEDEREYTTEEEDEGSE